MPDSSSTETVVWQRLRQGDKTALTELYDAFVQPLFRYGRRHTSDEALVMDCIHDVFLDLWKYAASLGEAVPVRFYLYRALKNRLGNALKRGLVNYDSDRAEVFSLPDATPDAELRFVLDETDQALSERLNRAVNQLPPRQKQVILLRFYDELSYAEIAALMDLTPQATYNVVFKALSQLRRQFGLQAVALGVLGSASLLAAALLLFF